MDGISLLTVTVLAVFVGFEVVSKVSSTLHTPLMSGANAIHGIILVGAIIVAGQAARPVGPGRGAARRGAGHRQPGGRLCGDRPDAGDVPGPRGAKDGEAVRQGRPSGIKAQGKHLRARGASGDPPRSGLDLAALPRRRRVLHPGPPGLSSPRTARRGNLVGAFGALLAVVTVFLSARLDNIPWIIGAIAVGTAVAAPVARRVKMTQMPQLVALFNGVGGGAAALVALLELAACRRRLDASRRRLHPAGGRRVLRRLRRHLRQAPGADDHPAGGVPRAARGHGCGAARRGGCRRRRRPDRFPARSPCC